MNYRKEKHNYFISLDPGDEINSSFEKLFKIEELDSAWINGIGAVTKLEIGFYELSSKSYIRKIFNDYYELTNLCGNITIKDGNIFSHSHINFSDKNFNVYGGHLFEGIISAAGEFILTIGKNSIYREYNDKIGLPLWCLNH